ncbi:lymphokine-activated killer T-cell-originated protein kinase homolog [Anopheles coustani]|uniref:lymphokine-activated killer T-cell-originated protein kinase homolog n=1 Tax=Anopheles coustani TaxID=139045 RepID=UPI0026594E23|nr:lymphokine-activated killer T-cell-originated protein kinase homolog [Anopheles coustani]
MNKNETPWKLSMLEMLNKHKSVELMPSEKNPANCDLEASVMELPLNRNPVLWVAAPPTPLVKTLGYGTGVQVYVVKRNLTTEERSPWAIKMLSARDPSNRAMFDKRLSQEAVIVENLKHPNIVGFRGTIQYNTIGVGRSFLALEYCNSSLGDILEKRYEKNAGPLEADKAKRMAIDVLSGLVYLHEDAHILRGDLKSFNGRRCGRAMFDKRLSQEAVIVENLKHPNIVGFRGTIQYNTIGVGRSFLALEYCNSSLGDILEKRYVKNAGPLEADKAKRMAIDVLSGLVYLHEDAHILHGDLKSFNVLINQNFENAKICDFDVSVPLNNKGYLDRVKAPNARYIGTTLWLPGPRKGSERTLHRDDPALISVKADIFVFGLTIYETLALTPPQTFAGIMDEVITHPASVAKRRLDMSADGEADEAEWRSGSVLGP